MSYFLCYELGKVKKEEVVFWTSRHEQVKIGMHFVLLMVECKKGTDTGAWPDGGKKEKEEDAGSDCPTKYRQRAEKDNQNFNHYSITFFMARHVLMLTSPQNLYYRARYQDSGSVETGSNLKYFI